MATYTKTKNLSISGSNDGTVQFDAISIADSQQFKRCKVEISGSYTSKAQMRGNAQSVFGAQGWNSWKTDKTGINWSKSGDAPKIKVHNSDTTARSWGFSVTIETEAKTTYNVTLSSGTGGTLTANKASTYQGDTVTLTATPNTNYRLKSLTAVQTGTSTTVSISNNKFTMPAHAVTVTATWELTTYTITKAVSPSGAGTVSGAGSAAVGASVTMTQTPASGYYFSGWTISSGTISSGGVFTMPAANVTVTANYLKYSTATINTTNLTAGGTAVLTIKPNSSAFSHKYRLVKAGATYINTGWVNVAAGVTSVTINIPMDWCKEIPSATSTTGLVCEVATYSGSTNIGNHTVNSNMTFTVPASVKPSVAAFTPSIARTIGGVTYANVGNYYVQGHCGTSVSASASGSYNSTITGMTLTMSGYSGSSYTKTSSSGSLSFTSGLLTNAGTCTITVTATDSRGRTASQTASITVTQYNRPGGSLSVWRVDSGGTADDMGTYGKFSKTSTYTAVGSNSLAVTLSCSGTTVTLSANTGDILPGSGNRKTFQLTQEYSVTMTLTDSFETTTITTKLPSARFIIHADSTGDHLGFMKAANKTTPSGKASTVEFAGDSQIYIGDSKLEDYILAQEDYAAGSTLMWTAEIRGIGEVTTDRTELVLQIPMNKRLPSGSSISCTVLKLIVRGIEGYVDIFTFTNRTNNVIGTTGYTITFARNNGGRALTIRIKKSSAFSNISVNNTPVVAVINSMTLTLS